MKYAIIEAGGKQYRVSEGDTIYVEKLDAEQGSTLSFDKVLLVSNEGEVRVGAPFVDGARVEASVVGHGKGKKILVFRYEAKKNLRRRRGHRQPYTKLVIQKLVI